MQIWTYHAVLLEPLLLLTSQQPLVYPVHDVLPGLELFPGLGDLLVDAGHELRRIHEA